MGAAMEWPRGEQYRDVPSRRDEGPKPEERKKLLAPSGACSLWILSLARSGSGTASKFTISTKFALAARSPPYGFPLSRE